MIIKRNNEHKKGSIVAAAMGLIVLFIVGTMFVTCNYDNHHVEGGYVGYVQTEPLFAKKEFVETIVGPSSTGYVWRQKIIPVSVTPWTKTERFTDILAQDKLRMVTEASIVFKINSLKVKEFIEGYAAVSEVDLSDPASLINDAYGSFIKEKLKTEIRSAVAKFNGLDAPSNIDKITEAVSSALNKHFEGTPFIIEAVTIGSTTPPENVLTEVALKVEVQQRHQRQETELKIAERQEEIAEAEGEAEKIKQNLKADAELYKQKMEADAAFYRQKMEAEGFVIQKKSESDGMKLIAEGMKVQADAISDKLIELRFIENMDKLKLPNTLVGTEIIGRIMEQLNPNE